MEGINKIRITAYANKVLSMERKNCIAGCGMPMFLLFIASNSLSDGGISGVVFMLHKMEAMEQTAPKKNEAKTQVGNLPVLPIKIIGKINNETLASVCPKPVKKLCA